VNTGVIEIMPDAQPEELSAEQLVNLVWTTQQLSENVINQVQINQAFVARLIRLEKQLAQAEATAKAAQTRSAGLAKQVEALIAGGGLGRQNSLYLGENLALARILGRFKMFVDTSDLNSCAALLGDGYFELGVTNWIPTVLQERNTFVDIGAN